MAKPKKPTKPDQKDLKIQAALPMRTERNAAEEVDRLIENGTALAKGVPGALLLDANYRRYAEMVVLGRAIPDARDGMKPVHRRILYDMCIAASCMTC